MPRITDHTRRLYRPLLRYLEQLPAGQTTSELTLAQLHALLGPTSAPDSPSNVPIWNLSQVTTMLKLQPGFTAHHNKLAQSITVQRLPRLDHTLSTRTVEAN